MRTLDLLLHIEVGSSLDTLDGCLDAVAYAEHLVEVGTKHLDGYAGTGTREHGIDAVADGGTYLDIGAGQGTQLLTYLGHQLLLGAVGKDERSLDLGHVDTEGMLVKFGTTGLATDGLYLGNGEQQLLGTATYVVGLLQRYSRKRSHVDGKRPLIEGGQERAAQMEESHQSDDKEHHSRAQHHAMVGKGPREGAGIDLGEQTSDGRGSLLGVLEFRR